MKTKVLSRVLLMGLVLTATQGHAIWNPFKKKEQPASERKVQHTSRKGKFTRGFRAVGRGLTPVCASKQGGKLDGFRRCLKNSLGTSQDMDKRSNVLAHDSTGKPVTKIINRINFRQDWFRRQMVLSKLTKSLLIAMGKINEELIELESQQAELKDELEGSSPDNAQLEAMNEKEQMVSDALNTYVDQFGSLWLQYGKLQIEMGQEATVTQEILQEAEEKRYQERAVPWMCFP